MAFKLSTIWYTFGVDDLKQKDEAYWRARLSPEEYEVLREKGTEPAFTGEYVEKKDDGMYVCKACGFDLFSSEKKYESGTGWPSFYAPATEGSVETKPDDSFFMRRTEVLCPRCGSHLGHVFDDGPTASPSGEPATGQRYCINSCSLKFEPKPKTEGQVDGD